jgi:dihydrofolate synthase / folylpolyglutamate synthase
MSLNNILEELLKNSNFNDNKEQVIQTINSLKIVPSYPIVLIGGTNGKGSVCAYLTKILLNAGYKVGTFTSPHVLSYNERIKINNNNIDDKCLADMLKTVISSYHDIAGNNDIGLFKAFTLASHIVFTQRKIDIAIIEVGIGGENDVTNLFEPTISAITNVAFDHSEILGDTLDKIGLQKSGIFRKNKPAFFGDTNIPQSILTNAVKIGTKLQILERDYKIVSHELSFDVICDNRSYFSIPFPAMRGVKQKENAALSIAILNKLKNNFPIGINHIKTGLLQTSLVGRFQIIPGLPQTVLDVAHNPNAISHMLENMLKLPSAKHVYAVFGIASDKDIDNIIFQCRNIFKKWYIAKTNSYRGTESNIIAEKLFENGLKKEQIIICESIQKAYNIAYSNANDNDQIIAFGSFLTVEEVYKTILDKRRPDAR